MSAEEDGGDGTADARIAVSAETRDRVRRLKRGGETYDELLFKMADGYRPDAEKPPGARITDGRFRALLDLYMAADGLAEEHGVDGGAVESLLADEARERGYGGWSEAYHEHGGGGDGD